MPSSETAGCRSLARSRNRLRDLSASYFENRRPRSLIQSHVAPVTNAPRRVEAGNFLSQAAHAPQAPPRVLGFWSAAALVVGHTIAVGIFLTPAELIGALASPALTLGLWIVVRRARARGRAHLRRAGVPDTRVPVDCMSTCGEAWGERVAFLYGWQSLLVMDPGITAALATGIAQYLVVLWPNAAGSEKLGRDRRDLGAGRAEHGGTAR